MLPKEAQQAANVSSGICGRSSDREDRRAQRFTQHRRTRVSANKLAVSCHGCQTVWPRVGNCELISTGMHQGLLGFHQPPLQLISHTTFFFPQWVNPTVKLQKPCYTKSGSWSAPVYLPAPFCIVRQPHLPIARCTASEGISIVSPFSPSQSACRVADTCNNKCEVITAVFSPGLDQRAPCLVLRSFIFFSNRASLPRPGLV